LRKLNYKIHRGLLDELIENEEKLYKVLKDEGSKINWD